MQTANYLSALSMSEKPSVQPDGAASGTTHRESEVSVLNDAAERAIRSHSEGERSGTLPRSNWEIAAIPSSDAVAARTGRRLR